MSEYAGKNQEHEMLSLGVVFKGFFIGVVAIGGIWLLSGLIELLSKTMG